MSKLKWTLLIGCAALSPRYPFAAPTTYQFEGPTDTICFVGDYDADPLVPPPQGDDWSALNFDSVWQTTTNEGTIDYNARFTRNFQVELEGVQGSGWSHFYFNRWEYPYGMYTFDAETDLLFEKGDKRMAFVTYGALFQDYSGAADLPGGDHEGAGFRIGTGITQQRWQGGVYDTASNWFVLAKITNGIAKCPGRNRIWKYDLKGPKEDSASCAGPGRPHFPRHPHFGGHGRTHPGNRHGFRPGFHPYR